MRPGNYSNRLVISRDGATIVLLANDSDGVRHLYLRSLREPEVTLIPGTANADMPFLSWDGSSVGYYLRSSGEIERVLLAGGASAKIADASRLRSGAAWGPDDTIVVSAPGLLKVSADGGTLEPLTSPAVGERGHRWPQLLPDGKTLLFTITTSDGFRPALVSMKTGDYHVVEELGLGTGARYLDSGHVVLAAEGQLLAAGFDVERLEATSRPVPVHDGIYTSPESGLAYFTTSDEGDLLYRSAADSSRQRRIVLVDRGGNASALFEERGYFRTVRFSPDGQKVAVTRSNSERRNFLDVWIYDVATGRRDRLTTAGADRQAIWSPDGTRVAFTRGGGSEGSFSVKPIGGDVEEELVSTGGEVSWGRGRRTGVPWRSTQWTRRPKVIFGYSIGTAPQRHGSPPSSPRRPLGSHPMASGLPTLPTRPETTRFTFDPIRGQEIEFSSRQVEESILSGPPMGASFSIEMEGP